MKPIQGNFYLLNNDKFYFSIDLQRKVKFETRIAIKCSSYIGNGWYFGELVDTSEVYTEFVTNNEITFNETDIIDTYKLKEMPLLYMDFCYGV